MSGRPRDLAITGGRRRPSGEGGNSRKFAEILLPDGTKARVPAAKDAATYVCLATPDGDWTRNSIGMLTYDATWLVEGQILEMEEMRPGYGMGNIVMLRVINSINRVQRHEGNYLQMQRFLLCEELESIAERMAMTAEDLLGET